METSEILDALGISAWHKAGYRGKGIKVMSGEKVYKEDYEGKVISPAGFRNEVDHGNQVMDCIVKVVPEAELYAYPISGTTQNGKFISPCLQYIKDNNINIFTTSTYNASNDMPIIREMSIQECIDNGTIFFICAGNNGNDDDPYIKGDPKSSKFLTIGAAEKINGKFVRASYSAIGEELDYLCIPFWRWTSFATPVFAGMIALVQQFFKEKTGRFLTQAEMIRFIDDNCIDLQEQGIDKETGKGLFILPKPEKIDVLKYVGEVTDMQEPKQIRDTGFLHPVVQNKLREFVLKASAQKLDILIYETYRTDERQLWCFNTGASQIKARGSHGFCVAFDVVPLKNGNPQWNDEDSYQKLGSIGRSIGLEWGGNWTSLVDKPHFQYLGGLTLAEWQSGKRPAWWDNWQIGKYEEVANMDKPSDWAVEAWNWGIANKICDGTNPKGNITREQVVQMLYNFIIRGGK